MKIGFIGLGNMASAMIGGILKKELYSAEDIIGSDKSEDSVQKAAKIFGIHTTTDNLEVAQIADVLILAVKPQFFPEVIAEIKGAVREETLIISIAPGKTMEWIMEHFGKELKLVRCMPNTPALVGEGMSCVCGNAKCSSEDVDTVCRIFAGFGKTEIVEEDMIDVVVGVSGSSPAYVFMFIEAMADAAVADGMPRAQAYRFAAQAVLGSAKMVLETGKHPGELKDMVCSPKGTTIEAVRVLEEKGLRSAVFEAMKACVKKGREV